MTPIEYATERQYRMTERAGILKDNNQPLTESERKQIITEVDDDMKRLTEPEQRELI